MTEEDAFIRLRNQAWERMMLDPEGKIPMETPAWGRWRNLRNARLWEAVALSLDFEPVIFRLIRTTFVDDESEANAFRSESPFRTHANDVLPTRRELEMLPRLRKNHLFAERLREAVDQIGSEGPLRPVHGIALDSLELTVVRLDEFVTWATSKPRPWSLPWPLAARADSAEGDDGADADLCGSASHRAEGVQAHAERAPTPTVVVAESVADRRARRLIRFRELGGEMQKRGETWHANAGRRGALAELVREERDRGRPRSDRSDVRKELAAAMELTNGGNRG